MQQGFEHHAKCSSRVLEKIEMSLQCACTNRPSIDGPVPAGPAAETRQDLEASKAREGRLKVLCM